MTISEKVVENFYNWEIKGRGYLLFPYNVDIEPTFKSFSHYIKQDEYIDDGKSPTILQRLFPPKKKIIEQDSEQEEIPPKQYEYTPYLKQINITFPNNYDFDNSLNIEFLNMLSESNEQISFEIIGEYNRIRIQIICVYDDSQRILHLLNTYFPNAIISDFELEDFPFEINKNVLIADFGYDDEFMRPITTSTDSLVGVLSVLEFLREGEIAVLQIIFKGVKNSWANSIYNSVIIGNESFFPGSPEMLTCTKEKISNPLFAVILRIAVQSPNQREAERLAKELIANIRTISRSEFNSLIPLNNEGYHYDAHLENLILRGTNRFGMIMNSEELSSFVHFPKSQKLISSSSKTKAVPNSIIKNQYFIGINRHLGVEKKVLLNDEQRLRHTHIIGGTGTGKSTFMSNLFLEDIKNGNGCAIFDPHGDTIDDIIPHIPEDRLEDVILIDPSDSEYSFGFNLLSAKTEVEKIVLSSDLVEAFKRHSTSWGDQMTSVLSNAINTFLNSETGGTLLELKRFLLENSFRKEFLKKVNDRSIHYYWNNEFVLLKRVTISPLITRLDTFLRPKIIRYMFSQKEGLDFNKVLSERKILLVKLSQGLIGTENSFLLGTIILSKIYQVSQSRQLLSKEQRHPFYIHLDEFQNFITPSINAILSGARKYGIGLVLAHQELNQVKEADILNSILSNANVRICFRLGDFDAKRLESGFSGFDNNDLQNLNVGEAIVRVGKKTDDFSLNTIKLETKDENNNTDVVTYNSRKYYSKKIEEIDIELNQILPAIDISENEKSLYVEIKETETNNDEVSSDIKEKSEKYIEVLKEKEDIREHRYLQAFIKKIAEQSGFKATIEEPVTSGRVDVSLIKDSLTIACEIAVSNSIDYEIKNIQKCIDSNYSFVCVISKDESHLNNIKERAESVFNNTNIRFLVPEKISEFLNSFSQNEEVKRIKGYRVKVNYQIKKD